MKFLLLCFLTATAFADVSPEVLIRGKIGNNFDDKQVKITDSLGQTYFLPRHVFPKEVKIEQGVSFAIEVHEKDLQKVKKLKK